MRGFVAIAAMVALAACNSGSGESRGATGTASADGQSVEFALTNFEEVSLRGPDNVEVSTGDEFSVRAEGDAEALEELEIEVRGNRLSIGRKDDSFLSLGGYDGRVTIYVTMPAIRGASVAGSGDMTVAAADSDDFEGSVAGSGNLSVGAIRATNAEFDIAGSGDISAAGVVSEIEISIAGSGSVEIGELQAEKLDVSIAGSGDVNANVSGEVDASIMGSGDVVVSGGAQCRSNSLGSGDLRCS